MNGTLTSKNFKVTFTVTNSTQIDEATVAATSAESRKYFKSITVYAPGDFAAAITLLNSLEKSLRAYVLAKIGG